MRKPRFIPYLLTLLLVWLGSAPGAHAGSGASAHSRAAHPPSGVAAVQADTHRFSAKADAGKPARTGPGRILFILASSTVHGASALPASISFGEVVNAWDVFQAAGYPVDFVSPDGGAVPILDSYVSKDMEPRLKDERIMQGLRSTAKPSQVDAAQYRAVYYVGGSNAIYGVPENPALQAIAMQVYERNGGVVSAVCHGTAGILNLRLANGQHLVAGKRITGFPEEYEEQDAAYFREFPFLIRKTVESRGGSFRVSDRDQSHVEIDGRVVTGQNYPSAKPVAQAVVDILRTQADPQPDRRATKN
ncbi:MAG: type 1 glutamine amidotransferase domain-containing protein [Rhodanobacteraceae bacterium]|nr:type 1 glutamine amidotransferase domain-containing protein [Rhodanobacteraceae bacterium]